MKNTDYKVSSGNVFADLGLDAPEEALAKGLTQAAAAKVLGIGRDVEIVVKQRARRGQGHLHVVLA